jgi:methyltransferase (TIGR00027 family)
VLFMVAVIWTLAPRVPRWPTVKRGVFGVFELDVPEPVDYREPRLTGSEPRCDRRVVRADLRADWVKSLRGAGFDRRIPTVWLAEGVLMYLTPEQNAKLVVATAHLSAPGSVLLAEHVPTAGARPPETDGDGHVLDDTGASWRSTLDDPLPWLAGLGWTAESIDATALAERVGRPLAAVLDPAKVGAACAHLLHGRR